MKESKTQNGPAAPWYKNGLRFQCRQCGACCSVDDAYVWVTAEDIKRLSAYFGMGEETFRRKYVKHVDGSTVLHEGDGTPCILFENNRCSAYPARPFQCRSFPFWRENIESEEHWREGTHVCPGVNAGRLYTLEEIERISAGLMDTGRNDSTADDLELVPAAALKELEELYARVDEAVSNANVPCDSCGDCCLFGAESPRLYCTLLEFAYMVKHGDLQDPSARPAEACPYWNPRTQCNNRVGRAVGCRTYFCRRALSDVHEMALREIKAISLRHGIPWDYKDLRAHAEVLERPSHKRSAPHASAQ